MVLEEFLNWTKHKISDLKNAGLIAVITVGDNCPNQSARLDMESQKHIARITFWDSGDCYCEILDVMSEKTVFDKMINIDFKQQVSFESIFDEFFNVLLEKEDS